MKYLLCTLMFFALLPNVAHAVESDWHFVPPEGSEIVNVKDYGAVGDGVTDDTEAIMDAIEQNIDKSRYRCNPFIYFPDGTYVVSGPIEGRVKTRTEELKAGKVWSAGWLSMMLLIGETQDKTIIKLADKAAGYGDADKPKWVIACGSEGDKRDNFGGGGNRAFRHGILNLTVDVGAGNPGAIGVDFIASNRGTVENVTITGAKGSGHTGLAMTRHWPGPAMIHGVTIDGFDRGIELNHYQYGMTFEEITLRNQRSFGIKNNQNVLTMRKVDFEGDVPFYSSDSGHNLLALIDSSLTRKGGSVDAAILTSGTLNLRNVEVKGFPNVVAEAKGGASLLGCDGPKMVVKVFDKGQQISPEGQPKPLNLPIEDVPIFHTDAKTKWVIADTDVDVLQKQIDDGAEYLYVRPINSIKLPKPLIIRNKLKLVFGGSGMFKIAGDNKVAIRIEDGSSPAVVFEHIYIEGMIEQVSKRTFALRHGDIHDGYLHGIGPGTSHIVDVIGKGYTIEKGHTFFARQLNAEFGSEPLFINSGTSWILGFKMESSSAGSKDAPLSTPSILNKDGKLELFGGLLYTLGGNKAAAPKVPAFTNEKGEIAISYRTNGKPETYYSQILKVDSFDNGPIAISRGDIKGPGVALLGDKR